MNVFDRPRKKRHSLSSLSLSLSSSNTVYNPLTSPSPSPTSTISSVSTSSSSSSSSSTTTSPLTDIGNKPKADTFFYDHINLSVQDHDIFDPAWIPLWESFDNRPSIRVIWKGSPLSIQHLPYYQQLHTNEQSIASTLRLTPEQYLKCKRALILSAKVFHQHGLPFRKSDAQKVCRIDVNKTSCLWGAFNRLGWFYPR
ncbi:Homeodomain-like protein [Halteromyces radiatus]|uniref:Homeodomain-like protein n=1 Tax=Halteromyces radiatus TaxID=101107 RepID=UPI002220C0B1|nr:Homeodomain-like protein [Halteromyces radiatus]KAI8097232.1 Homeodomain-like protein [Halteromyces radiatus]